MMWSTPVFGGGGRRTRQAQRRKLVPSGEGLEPRQLLAAGTDYTLMGGAWDNTRPISYSFAPDGVQWSHGVNSLNSYLDGEFGGEAWKDIVARSLQTWAASANIDFTPVADQGGGFDASGRSQGDPRFGDIRFAGYVFDNKSSLARTYGPPPNGATGAGDSELNISYDYSAGGDHDYNTIMLHELGHSLGLGESPQPTAAMYMYYSGVRRSLSPYDIEGIQSIYGQRPQDRFRVLGQGATASTAVDLTASLSPNRQAYLTGLDLTAIGDTTYFSVVIPGTGTTGFNVIAQASGISLMSPKLDIYDPSGTLIASNGDPNRYGNNAEITIPNAIGGQRYTFAVRGATDDVFAVGSYAFALAIAGGSNAPAPTPAPPPPPTPVPVPPPPAPPTIPTIPPDRFEASTANGQSVDLGVVNQTIVNGLTLNTTTDVDRFAITTTDAGTIQVASQGTRIVVSDASGTVVASGTGLIMFASPGAGARYTLSFSSLDGRALAGYGFAVATIAVPKVPAPVTVTIPGVSVPVTNTPPTRAERAAQARAARRAARQAAAAAAAAVAVRRRAARLIARAIQVSGD